MADQASPEELRARVAELEHRLQEMEGRRGSGALEPVKRLVPNDVRSHLRSGSREQLIALRTLLDHWITRLESRPAESGAVRREDIPIE